MDQKLGSGLTEWFWEAWGLSWGCRQRLAGTAAIWTIAWGWRVHSQGPSLPQMKSWCQLLAGGLSASFHGPFHWLLEFPQGMAPDFPHREKSRGGGGRCNACYSLASEVTHVTYRSAIRCNMDYTQAQTPGSEDKWGAFGRTSMRQQLPLGGRVYLLYSLILIWPCNLFCSVETERNDIVGILSQSCKICPLGCHPLGMPLPCQQPALVTLEDEGTAPSCLWDPCFSLRCMSEPSQHNI